MLIPDHKVKKCIVKTTVRVHVGNKTEEQRFKRNDLRER
jgi:hypothetical protein